MSQALDKKEFDDFSLKLFKYLDKRFKEMDSKFELARADINLLRNDVDAYAKQVEIYYHESVARDAKVDRLENWVIRIAKKTGVKLSYE